MRSAQGITLRTTPKPGDLGEVVRQHGLQYSALLGLDATFEAYVAKPLCEFVLNYDEHGEAAGCLWVAESVDESRWLGCVAMLPVAGTETDQLRWFLVDEAARGHGLGGQLLDEAIGFSRQRGRARVILWTLAELPAALKLYERAGFHVTETKPGALWGRTCTELKMELTLRG